MSALAGGLNLKAEEKGKFTSAAQDLFNEHLKRTGKEPVFEERQKILDQMVKEVVTKPGWLWDAKGPAYELPRDQLRQKTAPPDKFTPGQFYRDAENNRSKYLGNGKWEPVN